MRANELDAYERFLDMCIIFCYLLCFVGFFIIMVFYFITVGIYKLKMVSAFFFLIENENETLLVFYYMMLMLFEFVYVIKKYEILNGK
jgi:hypothetical protein